ncbi:lactonase family protein [Streptomyces sp. BA2]|uniref:lactonase family protein n=1 Tax=Streptomyces sp. BA2 TaxID=436595 RepID=UPI001322E9BC|nr:lactonase family protein [Streptomyces sp. BA2]MWA09082.1 beta-propeller fold lactonase family protein [Streptomyces sp. BA2]
MTGENDGQRTADAWGRRGFIGALAATAVAASVPTASAAPPGKPYARPLFLGTYTTKPDGGTGLGLATYDEATGHITGTGALTGVPDPSYLCLHPSGRTLYAVNEQERGGVTAIALSRSGPEVLGARGTGGAGPCHLSVHPSGRWLLSANYLSGSVAVHPVQRSGGLGELSDVVTHSNPPPGPGQDGPHAHQIVTSPDGGHVLAVDLGNDTVYSYRLDAKRGKLTQVSYATLRPGAGPRHLTFHPSGRFAYLANEVDNTVVVCGYDPASGRLAPGAPQSTGTGEGTSYPAQLLVTREGTFAFLANRGHNSLTRYAIEAGGASLRLLDTVPVGGNFPRHIAFSPSQRLLFAANQKSSSVSVFQVGRGGRLRLTGEPFTAPTAVCALPL